MMHQPQTYQNWQDTAKERAADATAMLPERSNSVGVVYMAGYAVECMLKAYLSRKNMPYPRSGQAGHNLRGLWQSAGFRLSDIKDHSGAKSFFVQIWDTALRYQDNTEELTHSTEELVNAAKQLTGWISNQIRHQRRNAI